LDQARDLVYVQYHGENLGKFPGKATLSLSYQLQQESQWRVKSSGKADAQGVDVGTLGFWAQFETLHPLGRLSYGVEYYHDNVNSYKRKYKADGSPDGTEIQGPVADDATYDLMGAFVQNEVPLSDKLSATVGARYTHAQVDAARMEDPTTGNPTSLSDSWDNIVGSLRFQYYLRENWNIFTGVSQGFRAPNLSDLTRLDTARTNEIETPSPGLEPEEFVSYEIGTKANFSRLKGQIAYFYTDIRDMIMRYPTGVVIDGDNEVQKANAGDGFVHGIEVQSEYDLGREWSLFGGLCWQEGEVDTYPTAALVKEREPMSRMAPLSGLIGVRWQSASRRYWAEGLVRMADEQDRLSSRDVSDTQRIPPGGTPGYAVYGVRGGIRAAEGVSISLAVENITNEDYRIHGSGQNEPGTNFIASLDYAF
ncbi:MAG: TonB-dependent receptor, partial [Planctomycetes bacterium]|nr:TonB-dependent receptor [Planctomycetota bacterium]